MISYCRWCDKKYVQSSKHQVYCCLECRQNSTRQKVLERQKKQKLKRRMAKKRLCSNCECEISIYNESTVCNTCMIDQKRVDKFLKDMRYLFDYEKK